MKETFPDSKLNDEQELKELFVAASEKFSKEGRPPVPADDDVYIEPEK